MNMTEIISSTLKHFNDQLPKSHDGVAFFAVYFEANSHVARLMAAVRQVKDEQQEASMQTTIVALLEEWCAEKRAEWESPT